MLLQTVIMKESLTGVWICEDVVCFVSDPMISREGLLSDEWYVLPAGIHSTILNTNISVRYAAQQH